MIHYFDMLMPALTVTFVPFTTQVSPRILYLLCYLCGDNLPLFGEL